MTPTDLIVVNYHGADELIANLRPLLPWPHGRVWVVDNSVDDAEWARLQTGLGDAVRCLRADTNLGFGNGCNLAWRKSTAPRVLLLNPDATLRPEAVTTLNAALDDDPRLAAVVPRIDWDADGRFVLPTLLPETPVWWSLLEAARRHPKPGTLATRGYLIRQQRQWRADAPAVQPQDFVSGAVLLLRRSAVDAAGGLFDPRYFMFYEDADLSLRLRAAGGRLGLVAGARAVHAWRYSDGKGALMADAVRLYRARHFGGRARSGPVFQACRLLACALPGRALSPMPLGSVSSLSELQRALGGAAVAAIGVGWPMLPAIIAAPDRTARIPDNDDWARLWSGPVSLLTGERTPRCLCLTKTEPDSFPP